MGIGTVVRQFALAAVVVSPCVAREVCIYSAAAKGLKTPIAGATATDEATGTTVEFGAGHCADVADGKHTFDIPGCLSAANVSIPGSLIARDVGRSGKNLFCVPPEGPHTEFLLEAFDEEGRWRAPRWGHRWLVTGSDDLPAPHKRALEDQLSREMEQQARHYTGESRVPLGLGVLRIKQGPPRVESAWKNGLMYGATIWYQPEATDWEFQLRRGVHQLGFHGDLDDRSLSDDRGRVKGLGKTRERVRRTLGRIPRDTELKVSEAGDPYLRYPHANDSSGFCLFDGSETVYNLPENPDVFTVLTPLKRASVTYLNVAGEVVTRRVNQDGCVADALLVDTVSYKARGFATETVNLDTLPGHYWDRRLDRAFWHAVPNDLDALDLFFDQDGFFRSWLPGSAIDYRALQPRDTAQLEKRTQETWAQMQPIDLDPYRDNGTMVMGDRRAEPYEGTVVFKPNRGFAFSGTGPVMSGGTVLYNPDTNIPGSDGFSVFDKVLAHEVLRTVGHVRNGPSDSVFGIGGAAFVTQDERRVATLAANRAGTPNPFSKPVMRGCGGRPPLRRAR